MSNPTDSASPDAWNRYWTGDRTGHAYAAQGVSQPALLEFWQQNLNELLVEANNPLRVLDLACGNGAISQLVNQAKGSTQINITCLDASQSALDNVASMIEGVHTLQSSMNPIPLEDGLYDLVVSQFGTEYAGLDAFKEAARMVGSKGNVLIIVHMEGSLIELESRSNFEAISALIESNFLDYASKVVNSGFQKLEEDNPANQTAFQDACRILNSGITEVENIMREHGPQVAAGTVHRLYNDVANIVENLPKYDAQEVTQWLSDMQDENQAFKLRMESMLNAALDESQFERLKEIFTENGFVIDKSGSVIDTSNEAPLAWALRAHKTNQKNGVGLIVSSTFTSHVY